MPESPIDKSSASDRGSQTPGIGEAVGTPQPVIAPVKTDTMMTGDAKVPTHPQSMAGTAAAPKTMGRYTILSELGRGGMGAVYLAEDSVLKRKVALKIPQFEPQKAEQMQARFLREAQLAAQLSHPNICQTYDVGVIDGQYVMAMEYIEGRTLVPFTKPERLLSDRQAASLVKKRHWPLRRLISKA